MKPLTLFIALALLHTVACHAVFTTLFVNGVDQGDGTCIRMPMKPDNVTDPINDLMSDDMACGYDGNSPVAQVFPVPQLSTLAFQFCTWADGSQPGAIDPSHKGPCAVYTKSVSSPLNSSAVEDGWFKKFDSTYNTTTNQWCTETLIANNGLLSVTIPSDLAGGYCLVRPELLVLHQADKTPPNPQFYVGCVQIFLNSTATSLPSDTVSIPGYVNTSDPGVLFNVWSPKWPYPGFGPDVYLGGISSSKSAEAVEEQTAALLPKNGLVTNTNRWGVELDLYSTEEGCWNASKACFEQCTTCYATAPPSGPKGCAVWDDYCTIIQSACNANDFSGPPILQEGAALESRSVTLANAYALLTKEKEEEATSGKKGEWTSDELLQYGGVFVVLYLLLLFGFLVYGEGGVIDCLSLRLTFTLP